MAALPRRRYRSREQRGGSNPQLQRIVDEIEELIGELVNGLERLARIRSIVARRNAAPAVGGLIGKLDKAMASANASIRDGERDLAEMARDKIVGQAIGQFLAICKYRIGAEAA